jgi:hypothetical protein
VHIDDVHTAGNQLRLRAGARIDRCMFGVGKYRGLAARHLTLRLDIVATAPDPTTKQTNKRSSNQEGQAPCPSSR